MKKLAIAALAILGVIGTAHAAGDAAAGKAKSTTCAACHGQIGNSPLGTFPNLAGQHTSFVAKQLVDFQSGARKDPTMTAMAAPLSGQDIEDLAAYFSSQASVVGSADPEKAAAGKVLFQAGNKAKGLAACMACHGPNGAGNPGAKFPALSGQHPEYVVKALKDFRSGTRTNDPAKMMQDVAAKMSDAEIEAVAAYIVGLH